MRGNLNDKLIETYHDDMQVGHHTAYKEVVEVFLGKKASDEALRKAEQDKNDLDAVVAMYGIAVYLEYHEKRNAALVVKQSLLRRQSVWPCISYLQHGVI